MIHHILEIFKKIQKFSLITLPAIILFSSCEQNPEQFGKDFIEPVDSSNVITDSSFDVGAYLNRRDSLNTTYLSYAIIGEIEDDYYGSLKSGFLTQLPFLSNVDFGPNPVIDSIFIYFKVEDYYGVNSEAGFSVYPLEKPITDSTPYYSNLNPLNYYNPASNISLSTEYHSDTKDSIKIRLDNSYGDFLLQYDTTNIEDQTEYYETVPGLFVTIENIMSAGGYLANIKLSSGEPTPDQNRNRIQLYYHNDSTPSDSSFVHYIPLRSTQKHFNTFDHNYDALPLGEDNVNTFLNNDTTTSDSLLFLESLSGTYVKFVFPESVKEKFHQNDSILLASAKLLMPVSEPHQYFNFSKNLYVYYFSADTTRQATEEIIYKKEEKYFQIDITDYLGRYIDGDFDQSMFLNIRNHRYQPGRVTLTGPNHSNPIKLEVKYYKP